MDRKTIGFQPVFESLPGQIVTQAFILCAHCRQSVSASGGPRSGVLCFKCTQLALVESCDIPSLSIMSRERVAAQLAEVMKGDVSEVYSAAADALTLIALLTAALDDAQRLLENRRREIVDLRAEPDAQIRAAMESLMNGDADHASFLLAKAIDGRIKGQ